MALIRDLLKVLVDAWNRDDRRNGIANSGPSRGLTRLRIALAVPVFGHEIRVHKQPGSCYWMVAVRKLLAMLNPINHALDRAGAERWRVEPYVAAAAVYAERAHVGRGGWTW